MPTIRDGLHTAAPESDEVTLVRPYALTRGRTQPRLPLPSGTLIHTVGGQPPNTGLVPELLDIVELCRTPRGITEIATTLGIPLGVAAVLVCDLADSGIVTFIRPPLIFSQRPIEAALIRLLFDLLDSEGPRD
ncbi:DUF742 domain-containing protein [Streptomyces sp. RB6PN25]|uniref:DUF742 domain-containing protein n=2 Tax=Streptomyces humicola TaxID=2953240 RepID=A0ABT1PXT2_9ACTN|nr:DUF742 domain-containing protein [Streptomyces humicola]